MKYVLASASPRRQELLTQAGFTFDVIPSAVDEKITKDIPSDVVMELAHQKALDEVLRNKGREEIPTGVKETKGK